MKGKNNILKVLMAVTWMLAGAGLIFLLVSAAIRKDIKHCKGLNISITGVNNNFFIDEKDVETIIKRYAVSGIIGKSLKDFRLKDMENTLKKVVWIRSAELYIDNNDVLQAEVEEREPIARVFAINNYSFYIDSSLAMLPLSEKFSARVPVFTGFPSDTKVLSKRDSALLAGIRKISMLMAADSFLTAIVEQVDINPAGTFEMLPKIGNQLIIFGDASAAQQKFEKLKLFYKQVMTKSGLGKYNVIDLQYKNQVVARVRGKEDIIADSLKTMQIMQAIALKAKMQAADSLVKFAIDNEKNTTDSSQIMQSLERVEGQR